MKLVVYKADVDGRFAIWSEAAHGWIGRTPSVGMTRGEVIDKMVGHAAHHAVIEANRQMDQAPARPKSGRAAIHAVK